MKLMLSLFLTLLIFKTVFSQPSNQKVLTTTKVCSSTGSYAPCSTQKILDQWSGILLTPRTEIDIAFNGVDEFFVAYLKIVNPDNSQQNSITGIRLNLNGDKIGDPIDIYPFATYPDPKGYPRLTFNPVTNQYFLVFEYGLYRDSNIVGGFISANGAVGTMSTLVNDPGRQASPFVTYNSVRNEYLLVYEKDDTFAGFNFVSVGYMLLTPTLTTVRGSTIIPCGTFCNNAYFPTTAVNTNTGKYLTIFEVHPLGSFTNDLNIYEIDASTHTYQDAISYATQNGNSTSQIDERSPRLAYSSSSGNFSVLFQGILNKNDPPPLQRNFVFIGVVSNGIFQVNSIRRPLSDTGDVNNNDPAITYSSASNRFVLAFTTSSPSQQSDIAFAAYDNSNSLVQQVPKINDQNIIYDQNPVIAHLTSDDFVVVWISDFFVPPPPQTVTTTKTRTSAGVIAAAVIVPIVTIIVLVVVGIVVWYKFLRIEFQHTRLENDDVGLPDEDGRFDAEGKPLYAEDGRPLYDEDGNPLYDSAGNPLYDEDGYPLYDTEGNPLYDAEGNALYSNDGGSSMVKDKDGSLVSREEFFKKKESSFFEQK